MAEIHGGPGNDRFRGAAEDDLITGGDGADTLVGRGGDDTLRGEAGDDRLFGNEGLDRLFGGDGDDTLGGGGQADTLVGGLGDDVLEGHSHAIASYRGAEAGIQVQMSNFVGHVTGGAGNDVLKDLQDVEGTEFADVMVGDNNFSKFWGFGGDDSLSGVRGYDTLDGGDGADTLVGGSEGHNWYVFRSIENAGGPVDLIKGAQKSDFIDLRAVDADPLADGQQSFTKVAQFTGAGAEMVIAYDADANLTRLLFDFDGDAAADKEIDFEGDVSDFRNFLFEANLIVDEGGAAPLEGTQGADHILGLDFRDDIHGKGGDDTIDGGTGPDVLWGDAGDDRLLGGRSNDTLHADAGDDTLDGGADEDTLSFSDLAVSLNVNLAAHTIEGLGHDRIYRVERVEGGSGDDTLRASRDGDALDGGNGNDLVRGGLGADFLTTSAGRDTLEGGLGDDAMRVLAQDKPVFVKAILDGGGGNDTLTAQVGEATLSGGDGDDQLSSGDGQVVLSGGDGEDDISGGTSFAFGAAFDGSGLLDGGAGRDHLYSAAGDFTLSGGAGADVFEFALASVNYANHVILDLENQDRIVLKQVDADATKSGDQAFALVAELNGEAGQLALRFDAAADRTFLEGDRDGDGAADFTIVLLGDHRDFTNFVL